MSVPMRRVRILAPLLVIAGVAVAACGGSAATPVASSAATSGPATAAPAATSASTAAPATADAGTGGCATDTTAVRAHIGGTAVTSITVIGGCHQLSIETSLDTTDVKGGLAICDKAAEVAYTGGINAITVDAANGRELATGLDQLTCLGEP